MGDSECMSARISDGPPPSPSRRAAVSGQVSRLNECPLWDTSEVAGARFGGEGWSLKVSTTVFSL
jgi:hypothetical protein